MKKFVFLLCLCVPFFVGAHPLEKELAVAKQAAQLAGEQIMHAYNYEKDWHASARAHMAANNAILKHLKSNFPSHACKTYDNIQALGDDEWWEKNSIWYFEAIDGFGEFYKKDPQFCVVIGLVRNGLPFLGVYYFPATDTFYWAIKGEGAFKQQGSGPVEKVEKKSLEEPISLFTYRKSIPDIRKLFPPLLGRILTKKEEDNLFYDIRSIGYRVCRIAEGHGDVYVTAKYHGRLWNLAAAQVLLEEVGCYISDLEGKPLFYRDPIGRIHKGAILCGDKELQQKIITTFRK
ncbi:MAG: inositol monophosphatase family protein [Verrucomicrobia bacterium]|nr:inositol monophosphatase family protein [Verrucomicrobiota bacterium]